MGMNGAGMADQMVVGGVSIGYGEVIPVKAMGK
jgi:hypothetical protein